MASRALQVAHALRLPRRALSRVPQGSPFARVLAAESGQAESTTKRHPQHDHYDQLNGTGYGVPTGEVSETQRAFRVAAEGKGLMLTQGPSAGASRVAMLRRGERVQVLQHITDPMRGAWVQLESEAGVRGFLKVRGPITHYLVPDAAAAAAAAPSDQMQAEDSSTADLATWREGLPRLYAGLAHKGERGAGSAGVPMGGEPAPATALFETALSGRWQGAVRDPSTAPTTTTTPTESSGGGSSTGSSARGAEAGVESAVAVAIDTVDEELYDTRAGHDASEAELLDAAPAVVAVPTLPAPDLTGPASAEGLRALLQHSPMPLRAIRSMVERIPVDELPVDLLLRAASALMAVGGAAEAAASAAKSPALSMLAARMANADAVPLAALVSSSVPQRLAELTELCVMRRNTASNAARAKHPRLDEHLRLALRQCFGMVAVRLLQAAVDEATLLDAAAAAAATTTATDAEIATDTDTTPPVFSDGPRLSATMLLDVIVAGTVLAVPSMSVIDHACRGLVRAAARESQQRHALLCAAAADGYTAPRTQHNNSDIIDPATAGGPSSIAPGSSPGPGADETTSASTATVAAALVGSSAAEGIAPDNAVRLMPTTLARRLASWPLLLVECGVVSLPPTAAPPPAVAQALRLAVHALSTNWTRWFGLEPNGTADHELILGLTAADCMLSVDGSAGGSTSASASALPPLLGPDALAALAAGLERHAHMLPLKAMSAGLWTLGARRHLMPHPASENLFGRAFLAIRELLDRRQRVDNTVLANLAWAARVHGCRSLRLSSLPFPMRSAAQAGHGGAPFFGRRSQGAAGSAQTSYAFDVQLSMGHAGSEMMGALEQLQVRKELREDMALVSRRAELEDDDDYGMSDLGWGSDVGAMVAAHDAASAAAAVLAAQRPGSSAPQRFNAKKDKAERKRLHELQVQQRVRTSRYLLEHVHQTRYLLLAMLDALHTLPGGDARSAVLQHQALQDVRTLWDEMPLVCRNAAEAAELDGMPTDRHVLQGSSWPLPPLLEQTLESKLAQAVKCCERYAAAVEEVADPGAAEVTAAIRSHIRENSNRAHFVDVSAERPNLQLRALMRRTQYYDLDWQPSASLQTQLDQMIMRELQAVACYFSLPKSGKRKDLIERIANITNITSAQLAVAIHAGVYLHFLGEAPKRKTKPQVLKTELDDDVEEEGL